VGESTWTLGLSTPEKEIFEYYGVNDFARSGLIYWGVGSAVCAVCAVLAILWFRRKQVLALAVTKARIAAEEASKAKSDFLALMSHEIRTPMNSILGFLELLSFGKLDAEQREYLSIGSSIAQNLHAIINDNHDYSKIEKGKMELDAVAFDPEGIADRAMRLFEKRAAEKGLRMDFRHDAVPFCVGDPLRFGQVLINLLGNAVKFTPAGGRVELELKSAEEKGSIRLRVAVSDTGIGISRELQTKIFDEFSQGSTAIAQRYGGTGLGLSLSAHLVSLMGGSLSVESAEGKGSRFFFDILLPPADHIPASKPAAFDSAEFAPIPMKVLVAEDTPDSLKLLVFMLERLGVSADTAATGEDALVMFTERRYDAVILDGYMPGINGEEVARGIRGRETAAGLGRTPIIALSAGVLESERERFLSAGADCFVRKPVSFRSLAEALGSFSRRGGPTMAAESAAAVDTKAVCGNSLIDTAALLCRCIGNAGFMDELLNLFVKGAPERREALTEALRTGDLEALRDAAHSLRGSSGSLCAKPLGDTAARLETVCAAAKKAGDSIEKLRAEAEDLLSIFDQSVEAAKGILGREGAC